MNSWRRSMRFSVVCRGPGVSRRAEEGTIEPRGAALTAVSRTDVAVQATGLIELRQERAEVVMLRTLARRAGRPGLGARNRRVPCADQHGAVTSTWAPSIAPTSMALWRPHGRCPSR